MPLCMCGHEDHEHHVVGIYPGESEECTRCRCVAYSERPGYARSTSFTDLPVGQGARDLYERYWAATILQTGDPLRVLANADPKDVTNLLWAVRTGKL